MTYYDPIQVEKVFQDTIRLLKAAPSERIQLNLIDRFLIYIEGNEQKFESYLIQILQLLPELTNPLLIAGIKPEILASFIHRIESSILNISDTHPLENAKVQIQQYKKALSQINQWVRVDTFGTQLEDALVVSKPKNLFRNGEVLIPAVEEYDGVYSGRLRKFRVEIIARSKDSFELKPTFGVIGADAGTFIKPVEKAVAKLVAQSDLKVSPWKASMTFETPHSWHAGKSANLAIAGAFYSEILKAEELQEQFWINPAACITGELDEDGGVLPVSYQTLKLKIEAAFFSWAQVLVVPTVQLSETLDYVEELKQSYPNRELSVIAVSHLKELFFDRRVSLYQKTDVLNHNLRKVWKRRNTAVIGLVFFSLVVIIGRLMYGPIDQNPVAVEFAGTSMILKNATGSVIDEIEVGVEVVNRENESPYHTYHSLMDADNDGYNDVIFYRKYSFTEHSNDTLFCFSIYKNRFLWKQEIDVNIDYSHRSDIMNDSWSLRRIQIIDEPNVKYFISSYQSRQFFPSLINKHDITSGEIVASYHHPGKIATFVTEDINNDGREEIVFVGNNNYYWGAVLGVLDPENLKGSGPSGVYYRPLDELSAKEIAYVRFPRTIIGKVGAVQKGTTPRIVYFKPETETITVQIMDFMTASGQLGLDSPALVYQFDRKLNIKSIGSSDMWDILAREYYQDGKLNFEPGYEYLESFKDSLEWWDGEKFVNYPTLANPYPGE